MVETSTMAIEAISANIVDTRFENFDKETINDAKNRLIDVFGCAIGGANAPGNAAIIDLVREWGGKKEATIWVHGGKAPAHYVSMLNTIMTRSYDFEVMAGFMEGTVFFGHHAASVIPTAIALGEAEGIDGKELLTAIILGDDVTARILVASAVGPIGIGWDGTMTLSHFGTTAVAGRLLGLDKKQVKHAFGIVLNMVAGAIQSLWDGATTFKMQGVADRNGIFAAQLAQKGWTGVADPLLSRFGYYNVYARGCKNPELLTRNLGKKYYGETYFKPYPSGMPTHPAIDAALALTTKNNIDADRIKEVIIYLPTGFLSNSYYAKPFIIRDFPHGDAIFSYPYTVASALLKKSMGLPNFTEEAIRDPKVNEITAKTNMIEQTDSIGLSVKILVKMMDGQEFTESKELLREWGKTPIPKEKILQKFWHQVGFSKTISEKKAQKVLDQIENLEKVENVKQIIQHLVV
jgi:2-methylcitrate dehydratase PrpD